MKNIVEYLRQTALACPQKTALEDNRHQLSYQQLLQRVDALSHWLQQQQTTCVALHGANSIDWVIVDLACHATNITCLSLPLSLSAQQIHHCVAEAGAELLLSEQILLPGQCRLDDNEALPGIAAWALPERYHCWELPYAHSGHLPEATQKIAFTAGITGMPKGVCLSREHQCRVARALAATTPISNPRHVCLLPLSTQLENVVGVYATLLNGGTVVMPADGGNMHQPAMAPTLLEQLHQIQPQSMILTPTRLQSLLDSTQQQQWQMPDSLEFVVVGGAPVTPQLLSRAHQQGIPVYEGYVLSECGSIVSINTPQHVRNGTAGKILPHCQVRIDKQEVIISGSCHLGYLGISDSWYPNEIHTGDLGYCDDGWLSINGRRNALYHDALTHLSGHKPG
ncbi:AMP-binding protein [Shewanella sp. YIC-542]|uniref:AMP-binding protein n=1 Tax=Shewanella mytili TaxID=3377111 RepID=UPI00398EF375